MKKTYRIEVDCANCADKMECAAARTPGVESVTVNFMTQKFTLEAPEEQFDELLTAAVAACKKVEPDCEIEIA